jgi:hypothetical protein
MQAPPLACAAACQSKNPSSASTSAPTHRQHLTLYLFPFTLYVLLIPLLSLPLRKPTLAPPPFHSLRPRYDDPGLKPHLRYVKTLRKKCAREATKHSTITTTRECSVYAAGYRCCFSCTPLPRLPFPAQPFLTYSIRLRTHASPVYLILFISATYFLNRPCVYCSLLLFILVVALFDFHTPWFDAPLSDGAELALNGTEAGVLVQAANATVTAVGRNVVEGVRGRLGGDGSAAQSQEWVKGLLGRREWKIQCLDVLIRV